MHPGTGLVSGAPMSRMLPSEAWNASVVTFSFIFAGFVCQSGAVIIPTGEGLAQELPMSRCETVEATPLPAKGTAPAALGLASGAWWILDGVTFS